MNLQVASLLDDTANAWAEAQELLESGRVRLEDAFHHAHQFEKLQKELGGWVEEAGLGDSEEDWDIR